MWIIMKSQQIYQAIKEMAIKKPLYGLNSELTWQAGLLDKADETAK